ncbi:uncharacterized protein KRP23_11515 [Phytophthora ramorum]|uniref:uncharacterized protein n=1 Tax=Phytophthora ramorum TaxID=164328 RepID=UPI0030B371CE|nr:hypothetical protein KRP23_11515 [Phytophthora ramorum]
MGSSQDEIRRLMKEAKQKPSTTAKTPSSAKTKTAKPSSAVPSQVQKPALPAGFFDDSLADAKARNVDVQQLAAKQLKSEWDAFQEFAQEVEQQTAKQEQEKVEESKEREAVEQLENMQYVDRYRVVLERATSLRSGENKTNTEKRKRQDSADDLVEEDGEAEGTSAVETAVSEYKKKHKKAKKQQLSDSEGSDDFDPCNWRSRGI